MLPTLPNERGPRRIPRATYRLQMHRGFTFADARRITDYLEALGVSDVYLSPILKSRPGSSHGYDITDHRQLNPEIGSENEFADWTADLKQRSMGVLLDIVPNHMAVVGNDNEWWNDILENGPSSPYAGYFDIAWSDATRAELQDRLLIPILGEPYVKVLESQQLRLSRDGGGFSIAYFDHRFPVAPRSYGLILAYVLERLGGSLDAADPAFIELQSILTAIKHLPGRTETDPHLVAERQREKEVIKRRLASLLQENATVQKAIDDAVLRFNGVSGDPGSFDLTESLLDDQVYRLAFWRVAAEEINYRRFFDINELAALSMERADVFAATHDLVIRLIREGKVHGLRIDHPDGLFDPREYLQRLQTAVRDENDETSRPAYVVVEKILGAEESLPADWPTDGTTGYDFLNLVNGLFVDTRKVTAFSNLYADWIGDETTFSETVYQKKILVLQIALAGEMQMLTNQLDRLAQKHRNSRDFTRNSLRIALREIIACFPVYRSYVAGGEVGEADRRHILRAVRRATMKNPALNSSILFFIRDTLLLRTPGTGPVGDDYIQDQRRFVGKFQQVTAPVMTKGAEDTAFYNYNRLLSINEVGGDPDRFGVTPAEFHEAMRRRLLMTPDALSATATHDTKRGEDVRARINVLSEIPDEWSAVLHNWSKINERHRVVVEDILAPDRNEEYFLYQTIVGALPEDPAELPSFVSRLQQYLNKALHEAKIHTSWINPNQAYDDAISQFIAKIIDPDANRPFFDDLTRFVASIRDFAMANSLAQTLLKVTAPGVPDIYQGTELWDLSLVDPDNRRAVNYEQRAQSLDEIRNMSRDSLRELVERRGDGRIKMFVLQRALEARRKESRLFARGSYLPIDAHGPLADHVLAFARAFENRAALVVVPRLMRGIRTDGDSAFQTGIWQGTSLSLRELPRRFRNAFTGESIPADDRIDLDSLLTELPVCLLVHTDETDGERLET